MGLYKKFELIYGKALEMWESQAELLGMLKDTKEYVDGNKRKVCVCIVGMKGSGKSLVLNYLSKATHPEDFEFAVGGIGTQIIQVYEGEKYDFIDTPALDYGADWVTDEILDRIDICILAHNVSESMTREEEEFVQKYIDRKYGLDFPIIKFLTFCDQNFSQESIEDVLLEMNEKIEAIRAKSFNCSDKYDELKCFDELFFLSPGPSYLNNLTIIGEERYRDYYGDSFGSFDLADVRDFLLDNFSEQQAILTNAMFWALTTFYCSNIYQQIANLHAAEVFEELSHAIDGINAETQFNYDETLEKFFEIVGEDFTNNFETALESLFRAQKWRSSPSDDKEEVENEVKNLISVIKNQHIFTAKANPSARDFIKSLMRVFDFDRLEKMTEQYINSSYLQAFKFLYDNGPEISYQEALAFVQECENSQDMVSTISSDEKEWAKLVCHTASLIVKCQIIFGLDIKIDEEFYKALIDLCQVSIKIGDTVELIDFDDLNDFDPSEMRKHIKEEFEEIGNMY